MLAIPSPKIPGGNHPRLQASHVDSVRHQDEVANLSDRPSIMGRNKLHKKNAKILGNASYIKVGMLICLPIGTTFLLLFLLIQNILKSKQTLEAKAKKRKMQMMQQSLADGVQDALEAGDVDAIEKALQNAEAQGVAQPILDKFREELKEQKAKKVTEAFHAAMQSDDTDAIEEAIRVAEAQGLPEMLIQKFRQELQEQNARKAADAVQAALQHNDAGAIEEAIRLAEAQGLPETHIRKFRQNLEDLRVKEATERLQAAMHGSDVDAIEEALRLGESQGVPSELIERFRRELDEQREQKKAQERRERFFAELQKVLKSDSIPDMRGAIAEGEALGLDSELEPARKAIEEELQRRMAKALEERQAQEKLAGEFKSAKEAQDFGGVVLVAQWRAAVAEVAKPFAFSEE